MKILIISGGFFPTNSPQVHRTTELVKEFCNQGNQVELITSFFDNRQLEFSKKYNFKFIDFGKKRFKLIPRSNNKTLDFFVRGINRILINVLDYPDIEFFFLVKKKIKNLSGYDLVISVAAPHSIHWAVRWTLRNNKTLAKVWIADCGDPFYANQVETYKKAIYFKWIEQWWCRKADFITIPKYEYMFSFLEEFHFKIKEVTQGFDLDVQKSFLKPYKKHKVPTFIYAGSLVPIHRDPSKFLDYLVSLPLDFKFHFYTRQKHFVEPFLERANGRIVLHDYLSREDLISELSTMDFIVNFMYDPYKYAPSKMADFLFAERPILNIDYKLDNENIDRFLSGDYSKSFDLFTKERFDIKTIIKQFKDLYNSAIESRT